MQQDWNFSGSKSDKLLCWSLVYIAAIMPFQKPVVPLAAGIILMVAAWLFSGGLKTKIQTFFADKKSMLFASLYLFYCIGFFYSENSDYALTDLLLKSPLLLFPLVLSSVSLKANKDLFFKIFLFSSLVSVFFCLVHAAYQTHTTGENYFFYARLSYFIHVGHYAMYLSFAAFISLYFLFRENVNSKKTVYVFSFVILAAIIFLLSARAQLIAFFGITYFGIILFFFSQKKWLQGILVLTLSALIGVAALQFSPRVKERIVSMKNETVTFFSGNKGEYNSVSLRFMIWESGVEVIKQNLLFGTGTGDAKDKLKEEALKKNYTVLVERDLNYHNQYFQTMAAIGLPGLLLLLSSIVVGFAYGVKKQDYLCLSFFIIFTISCLTESVLERQTGVIFYSFFSALLIFVAYEKNAQVP